MDLQSTDAITWVAGQIWASVAVSSRRTLFSTQFTFAPFDGDFNLDGVLGISDLDLLTEEISAGQRYDSTFDLSHDGVVDVTDLAEWLSDAADHNGVNRAYLVGDSNLDGSVDSHRGALRRLYTPILHDFGW